MSTVCNKKTNTVKVIFAINTRYIGVAFRVLSDLLKLCSREMMELETFATKFFRRLVHRGDTVENSGVKVAAGILVALCRDLTLMSQVKYFTASFEIEQKFLALAIAKELKKMVWQQDFFLNP